MRVDYSKENYCGRCDIKYPKDIFFCDFCHFRLRTTPRNAQRQKSAKKDYWRKYSPSWKDLSVEIHTKVDYTAYNYCSICMIRYPKTLTNCLQCRAKLRTKPRCHTKNRSTPPTWEELGGKPLIAIAHQNKLISMKQTGKPFRGNQYVQG